VDRLDRIGEVAALARRTRRIALQSVLAGMGMSLAAMVAAGLGLLPAVWGALLQEAIDVAVILNALRALRPGRAYLRLAAADAELTARFQAEHEVIRADIDELRAAADALGLIAPGQAMAHVRRAYRLLADEIGPHESAEQNQLYPAIDRILGRDATATMARAHAEVAHQTRRLGALVGEIGGGEPDGADVAELRALLYGLHAILKLHTAQEDESYLSLGGETPPGRAAIGPVRGEMREAGDG
jgi:iron-sulfur cluster repair protein YtfE (RIC family)